MKVYELRRALSDLHPQDDSAEIFITPGAGEANAVACVDAFTIDRECSDFTSGVDLEPFIGQRAVFIVGI